MVQLMGAISIIGNQHLSRNGKKVLFMFHAYMFVSWDIPCKCSVPSEILHHQQVKFSAQALSFCHCMYFCLVLCSGTLVPVFCEIYCSSYLEMDITGICGTSLKKLVRFHYGRLLKCVPQMKKNFLIVGVLESVSIFQMFMYDGEC